MGTGYIAAAVGIGTGIYRAVVAVLALVALVVGMGMGTDNMDNTVPVDIYY